MKPWTRKLVGDLPLYQAQTLSWLPQVVQGFTTRQGGVGVAPFDSFNLGPHVGDMEQAVTSNLHRLLAEIKVEEADVAFADQVHGSTVSIIDRGGMSVATDALVTASPILLLMYFADCAPVYVVDPLRRVVALAHSGWRGTVSNIAGKTIGVMADTFGSLPSGCLAAIGPSIGGDNYTVGADVADQFRNSPASGYLGAATAVVPSNEFTGKYSLNLRQIIFTQLLEAGIPAKGIAVCPEDTFRNRRDFFSYRRDKVTGRMAAFIGLRDSSSDAQ